MPGSRNFRQGGPGQSDKKSSDVIFFLFFFSPQLILQKSNGWIISSKTIIFQGSRGGPTFSRGEGGELFPGGSNCLFPIETHITCDFPGGGGVWTPYPPLWISTWVHKWKQSLGYWKCANKRKMHFK